MHFCTIYEITFLVNVPLKSNVVLQKSFKMVAVICINPVSGVVRVDKRLLRLVDGIQGNH